MTSAINLINSRGGKATLTSNDSPNTTTVTMPTSSGTLLTSGDVLVKADNLSDVPDKAAARANLGINIGVAGNDIVQLDAQGKLPAVDGSQLKNLPVPQGPTAKAWLRYNAQTKTLISDFNIKQVIYETAGNYTIEFENPLPDANYAVAGSTGPNGQYSEILTVQEYTSGSSFKVRCGSLAGGAGDPQFLSLVVFR